MNVSVPIGREVTAVSFSFFSSEEIRRISVKQINNPTTFDPITNHPNKNGLYDSALGPLDKNHLCSTCHLNYFQCPGHFGHVELAVPVYHPLLFKSLFSLLRSTCFYCHRFKMREAKTYRYMARLKLLFAGLVVESMELESLDFSVLPSQQQQDGETSVAQPLDDQDIRDCIDAYMKNAFEKHGLDPKRVSDVAKVTLTNDYARELIKDFLARVSNIKKCEQCSGKSVTLRKETHSKIFESAVSRKDQAEMDALGLQKKNLFAGKTKKVTESGDDDDEEDVQDDEDAEADQPAAEIHIQDSANPLKSSFLTSIQVKEHMRLLWDNEHKILDLIFGSLVPVGKRLVRKSTHEQFFLDSVAVPPARFRPMSRLGDKVFDHSQNIFLCEIIKSNNSIVELRAQERQAAKKQQSAANGDAPEALLKRLVTAWVTLQESVNNLHDSSKNPKSKKMPPGIKQIMEKKEGLFRKHMMGKRVNYAARSVISPDPMIETSEIGIPMVFAKKLTYPEPVTHYNIKDMRQAVINGPDQYPGASAVQHEDGTISMLQNFTTEQRVALANQLLTPASNIVSGSTNEDVAFINKKVHRHLKNGDMLLLNRQPTLHKPSIMGHVARVLPGEKTIRMHYANCNTYNADFDGDEMNVHFPQNPIAQAEARLIANTNNQYLVPTSGEPLRGLIQDHVVTGVLMTARDTFFTKEDYHQLIFNAIPKPNGRIILLPPTLIKPEPRWTGKQVISTLLANLTKGRTPLNLDSKTQTPSRSWSVGQAVNTEEGDVIIRDGELLTGILDKKQFGAKAYGLVHACYEVYGGDIAGQLLSSLGRLFTTFVRFRGFTCRMDDLIVTAEADAVRREKIVNALAQGKEILKEFAFGKKEDGSLSNQEPETAAEKQLKNVMSSSRASAAEKERAAKTLEALEERKLYKALEDTIRSDEKLAQLDSKMKSKTGEVTTGIVKSTIPNGLYKPFPDNGMQLMTVSGAKGSNVNVTQISCMLGQQELEGRRVPVMVSGKTLPSFRAYDLGPRAGGYITGRFLTGIKPQEYYFHCMAGREGLVDTAVKTARSGYLQRCLIKHLEGMKVNYDNTVRDAADGSLYQFNYGEDSLDVTKASYLNKFKFNAQNYAAFLEKYRPRDAAAAIDCEKAIKYQRKAAKKPNKYGPVLSKFNPSRYLGAVSDKFNSDLQEYIKSNPDGILNCADEDQMQVDSGDASGSGSASRKLPKPNTFEALMHLKYLNSLVEPGEAVGLLAAQSIGEPSTQMTLNTFHFAGHGAKNVTLGIPRLREIIMTASTKLKTPLMTVPFRRGVSKKKAERVCRQLSRLTLDMIMEEAVVTERLLGKSKSSLNERTRSYTIRLKFCEQETYRTEYGLDTEQIQAMIQQRFVKRLISAIMKDLKGAKKKFDEEEKEIGQGVDVYKFNESSNALNTENEDESARAKSSSRPDSAKIKSVVSDDEEDAMELDATAASRAEKRKQKASYDGPDEDDKELMADMDRKGDQDSDDDAEDSKSTVARGSAMEAEEDDAEADGEQDEAIKQRRETIVSENRFVKDYRFDERQGEWCEIELRFPADTKKILMVGIVERIASMCVLREVPGIQKCFVNESKETGELSLTSEGSNLKGLWDFETELDISKVESNDIASILRTYGVEAARKAIVKEISGVFAVYGIEVDTRHLSLIADYMTFEGGYKPFNRIGIESCTSPFAKMSFETTFKFLTDATLRGDLDTLQNPSARLVMGKVVDGGTGAFEILQTLTS